MGVQIVAHQPAAIAHGDVIDLVAAQACGVCVVCDDGFTEAVQIQVDQPAGGNAARGVLLREEQNAIGVDGEKVFSLGGVYGRAQAGNIDVSAAVREGGQFAAARHQVALAVCSDGMGGYAEKYHDENQ